MTADLPPAWLDELTMQPGPPWLVMGTRALDLDRWLIADDRFGDEMALKERLLEERPDEVVAVLSDSEAGGREALELVESWLTDHSIERPVPAGDRHPIDAAGRLVQEDLCLVEDRGGSHVMTAGSVCFPSHWRINDKLGRSVAEIHAPVHHYDDELRGRVDTFFSRLRVDRPVWRRNLSIHDHDDLFRPEPHESPEAFDGLGPDDIWLRSEYQTLRRLPRTRAILFTIKTQQCPLSVLNDRPDVGRALGAKLQALEPELQRMGNPAPFPTWLPDWLTSR